MFSVSYLDTSIIPRPIQKKYYLESWKVKCTVFCDHHRDYCDKLWILWVNWSQESIIACKKKKSLCVGLTLDWRPVRWHNKCVFIFLCALSACSSDSTRAGCEHHCNGLLIVPSASVWGVWGNLWYSSCQNKPTTKRVTPFPALEEDNSPILALQPLQLNYQAAVSMVSANAVSQLRIGEILDLAS